jgi:TnpA family transposase
VIDNAALSDAAAREQLRLLLPTAPLQFPSKAAATRYCLAENFRRVQRLLQQLLSLAIAGEPGQPALRALAYLRQRYAALRTFRRYPKPTDLDTLVPGCWVELVNRPQAVAAWHAFEAATLLGLQRGLRNGTLWVAHSLSYRDKAHWLIEESVWTKTRQAHYLQLGLPRQVRRFLDPLQAQLQERLHQLADAVAQGDVTLDEEGLHHPRWLSQDTCGDSDLERRHLTNALGTVQLPELLLDMDSHTRFSWVLLGRPPRHPRELLTLYGALLAHGTEQTAKDVALMMPNVSEAAIFAAMAFIERDDALRTANDTVVEFIHRHAIVRYWGDGTLASADGMSLEAAHHLWLARVDPRRRHPSVGLYTHVLDRAGIIYDQPIVLGQRQAGAAIEGILRQQSTATLSSLMVDSHGHTDAGMGLAKLLGFDLCPRLKALRDRKLYVPTTMYVPDTLGPVTRKVSVQPTVAQWDGLVRLAASVKSGHLTAVLALHRLGSAARGEPLYRPIQTLGRLCRTLWLCDFLTNRDFQHALERQLNHGEQLHTLQRALYAGAIGPLRGRRFDELNASSGALSLLTNLVLAWNTHHLQMLLDTWKANGELEVWFNESMLKFITPARFREINFRGQFHFPINAYAGRLIPGWSSRQATQGGG